MSNFLELMKKEPPKKLGKKEQIVRKHVEKLGKYEELLGKIVEIEEKIDLMEENNHNTFDEIFDRLENMDAEPTQHLNRHDKEMLNLLINAVVGFLRVPNRPNARPSQQLAVRNLRDFIEGL